MKRSFEILRYWLLAIVAISTAGCAGQGCNDENDVTDSTNLFRPYYVYTANKGSNNVSMFEGAKDGTLKPIGTIAAGPSPNDIAVISRHHVAYVVNSGNNTISQYSINSRGILSPLTPATITTGANPQAILSNNEDRVLVACAGDAKLYVYRKGANGSLNLEQTLNAGAGAGTIGYSSRGGFYVSNFTANTISVYAQTPEAINPSSPATVATGAGPTDFGFDTDAVYVLNSTANTITSYLLPENFNLDQISSPQAITVPPGTVGITNTPSTLGTGVIWAISNSTNTISRYKINPDTNRVSRISGVDESSGGNPTDIQIKTVDARPFPQFLFVTTAGGQIRSYSVNEDQPSFLQSYSAGSNPVAIAVTNERQFNTNLPLEITTTSLPNGTVGADYNQTIQYAGGDVNSETPFVWTVSAGSLPSGLTLGIPGGVQQPRVAGTPTQAGTFNFTLRVAQGETSDTQTYTVTITGGSSGGTFGRVINAGFGVQNIDAYLHPVQQLANNLPYESSTYYVAIPTGNQNLRIFKTSNQVSVFDGPVTIAANTRNAFVALGNAATSVGTAHISKATNYQPASGKAAIRFVNGFSNVSGNADVVIVPPDAPVGHSSAVRVPVGAYKAIKLHELTPGTYDLVSTPAGSTFEMFRTRITVAAGNQRIAVLQSPTNIRGSFLIVND